MKIVDQDFEVFTILEKFRLVSFDPKNPKFLNSQIMNIGTCFFFLLVEDIKDANCTSFKKTMLPIEIGHLLLPSILKLPDDHQFDQIKNLALSIIEKKIEDVNLSMRFFDAH
jgi:hypothetical protein